MSADSIRRWPHYLGGGLFVLLECWTLGALLGATLWPKFGARLDGGLTEPELILLGVKYFGGLGLYLGAQIAVIRAFSSVGRSVQAAAWCSRFFNFHFTVLGICALGALLGAVVFPLAGSFGGSLKTRDELVVLGARTGGFFFLVWAPGFALVREFIRAARRRSARALREKEDLSSDSKAN